MLNHNLQPTAAMHDASEPVEVRVPGSQEWLPLGSLAMEATWVTTVPRRGGDYLTVVAPNNDRGSNAPGLRVITPDGKNEATYWIEGRAAGSSGATHAFHALPIGEGKLDVSLR